MEFLIQLLEEYGYWGMTVAAFLAGSVFPFSSEAVMVSLQLAGLEPWPLFLSATIGNVAGSMFNYWIGTFGRLEWIEKYLHIKREKVEKTRLWLDGRGAWVGSLCFLPILGSVLSVTLGYMRANPYVTFVAIFVGKAVRYSLLIITTYYLNN
jgi:membrane protein YqaA with SNARE-associated domain